MAEQYIIIRFIRNHNKKNDDKVFIRKTEKANQFILTHYFAGHAVKVPMTDKTVFRWVRNTIRLLKYDTVDPFIQIQIDYPMMPTVLINMADLQKAYNNILDCLDFQLNYWMDLSDEKNEDSDSDSDSDSETNTYTDMPPLIPVVGHGSHHLFLDQQE